eukprot:TRINITY_DN7629_c0_g1_i13.p2 TRINITY_DN7629_c0_g1~~TRINITY_DN7629_c0_g1_i13.p2  ORF type:complete len:444 (-),score=75.91 TRINITY_DN7629_c0_g1_i13:1312-2643(-)
MRFNGIPTPQVLATSDNAAFQTKFNYGFQKDRRHNRQNQRRIFDRERNLRGSENMSSYRVASWKLRQPRKSCQKQQFRGVRYCVLEGVGGPQPEKQMPEATEKLYEEQQFLQFPSRQKQEKPTEQRKILVRFKVNYRVHSRQILCMGGSQLPFGWAFLSITKVPMTWNKGDDWTRELQLPVGMQVEYKYVILERQDWIKIQDDSVAEGMVTIPAPPRYRTGFSPEPPPQIEQIEEKMAIVSWQPGPNRVLKVPDESELQNLKPGDRIERSPARPRTEYYRRDWKTGEKIVLPEHQAGTKEFLQMDEDGVISIERYDVWGYDDFTMPSGPSSGGSPLNPPSGSIQPPSKRPSSQSSTQREVKSETQTEQNTSSDNSQRKNRNAQSTTLEKDLKQNLMYQNMLEAQVDQNPHKVRIPTSTLNPTLYEGSESCSESSENVENVQVL